ncbi:hypothetical protein CYY_005447 [Polysphondylium violaceum]|uniref:Prefoldin alpha subunit family protein n=1 Tax=Polysphondylium violaceum TaxID=133409 RepID=A0A8J4PU86_9MYCE|nr:hypothetical protein CYY_005447 [Polysphondylium violaceum]
MKKVSIQDGSFSDKELIENEKLLRERIEYIDYYERFIQNLHIDLERLMIEREKIAEDIENYSELKSNIELIKENKLNSMKTMINLGLECYVQAKVEDTNSIFIDVGLGIHVKFNLNEGIQFINQKEAYLNVKLDNYTKKINQIKTKIDLMQKGINDLNALPNQ